MKESFQELSPCASNKEQRRWWKLSCFLYNYNYSLSGNFITLGDGMWQSMDGNFLCFQYNRLLL